MTNPSNITILMAEDSEDDRFLYGRVFEKLAFRNFRFVTNGEDVIAYLRADGKYSDRDIYPFPDWLILDLKMPRKGGFEVVKWLREHPDCSVIPTIILSSSVIPSDVKYAYQLGVNTFFSKPHTQGELLDLIQMLLTYWCKAEVPEPPPTHKCG